ncbi:hypothetical protein KJ656_04980 [bacterium]|nr:hypothetical protein [bacterium]
MAIIYISGIDGCGKTTQAKLLVSKLITNGFDAEYIWMRWEPSFEKIIKYFRSIIVMKNAGKNPTKKEIENIEYGKWDKFKRKVLSSSVIRQFWWLHACADYYYTSRKQLREINAKTVVIDRYVDDFIIDQAINFGLSPEACVKLEDNVFLKKFKTPDIKIIIDLSAIGGYTRKKDGTPLNYLKQREAYYKRLHAMNNSVHLDGFEDIHSLASKIDKHVTGILIRD